jgi:hypothetical protein
VLSQMLDEHETRGVRFGPTLAFLDQFGYAAVSMKLIERIIASELTWKELGLTLRQETQFPAADTTRLTLTCDKPVELRLYIRHPYWAASGIEISVNGQKQAVESRPGSYAGISRRWASGDTVEVRMPMGLRTEALHRLLGRARRGPVAGARESARGGARPPKGAGGADRGRGADRAAGVGAGTRSQGREDRRGRRGRSAITESWRLL